MERAYNEQKKKRAKLLKMKENKECLDRMQRKADSNLSSSIEKEGIQAMVDNLKKSIANMIKNNRVKESNKIRVMRQLKA